MRASDEDKRVVGEALAQCDLGALAERRVDELSGGEQKRVAIARALAQKPRVLLLDEPAAFLDVRHQIALYDLLAESVAREDLACLVVMHDLNVASQYATRVVLAKEGRFVAVGAVDEVMTYRTAPRDSVRRGSLLRRERAHGHEVLQSPDAGRGAGHAKARRA